jgi:hypothetical protein
MAHPQGARAGALHRQKGLEASVHARHQLHGGTVQMCANFNMLRSCRPRSLELLERRHLCDAAAARLHSAGGFRRQPIARMHGARTARPEMHPAQGM